MEVVKNLGEHELDLLRTEFEKGGEDLGLEIDDFATVLKKAAVGKNISGTAITSDKLHDLFNEIDFNGDARVSWEEFTMFIIDNAMKGRYEGDEKIRKYIPVKASRVPVGETNETGGYAVAAEMKKLKYFSEWDEIIKVSTFGNQHKLKVIDPKTLKGIKSTPRLPHSIMSIERTPEQDLLITSSSGMEVHFWDMTPAAVPVSLTRDYSVTEGILPLKRVVKVPESQLALRWCSKYKVLFSASRAGALNYWSVERMEITKTQPKVHEEAILDLLIVDQEVVTASLDSTIKIMNLERNVCTGVLKGHGQGVCTLAFSKQHQFLLSAGFEYEPLVWVLHIKDFHPWRLVDKQRPHHGTILGLYTVPDTPQVITADNQGMVKVWDIRTFQAVQTIIPWQQMNTTCRHARSNLFSAVTYIDSTDSIILSGPRSTFVYKYQQTSNHDCVGDAPVVTVLYNTVTRVIISVHKKSIKIWEETTGLIESVFDDLVTDEITSFCMCGRGRKFFVGTIMGQVSGYVASSGACIQEFGSHKAAVASLCYGTGSRGHKFIISVSQGGTPPVQINWDSQDSTSYPATAINAALQSMHATFCAISHANSMVIISTTSGRILCSDTYTFALTHVIECAGSAPQTYGHHTSKEVDAGCTGEVSALSVLGTLPAFACSDPSGYLYIWSTRPYPHPQRLLAKWFNRVGSTSRSDTDHKLTTTSIACHEAREMLYVGDDMGFVNVYSIRNVIQKTGLVPSKWPAPSSMDGTVRPPPETITDVPFLHSWKAHDDEINSVQVVIDVNRVSVFTSGFDFKVHIWNTEGVMIGSLCQGREREKTVQYSRMDRETTQKNNVTPWEFKEASTMLNIISSDTTISKAIPVAEKLKAAIRKPESVDAGRMANEVFLTTIDEPEEEMQGRNSEEEAEDVLPNTLPKKTVRINKVKMPKTVKRAQLTKRRKEGKETAIFPDIPKLRLPPYPAMRNPLYTALTHRPEPVVQVSSPTSTKLPVASDLFRQIEETHKRYCGASATARLPTMNFTPRAPTRLNHPPSVFPYNHTVKQQVLVSEPVPHSSYQKISYWADFGHRNPVH